MTDLERLVSIHAPAWGATSRTSGRPSTSGGFNPRTRVGCDADDLGGKAREAGFQSTHPRGVRRESDIRSFYDHVVSIHAPAWGATRGQGRGCAPHRGFNPRTRVGCDREEGI